MALHFKNPFSKPTPAEKKQKDKQDITKSHQSEKAMRAELVQIDLDDPRNLLSQKKIQALNIRGVIDYANSELKYPLVTDYDLTNLDNNMKFIIRALNSAVKEGLEDTAEWACSALVFAIKSLRTEIDGIDTEWADAMWECRTEYSENLKLLVQACINKDHAVKDLADQRERRVAERTDLDARKSSYKSRLEAGKLGNLLAELKLHVHKPGALSDDAKALREELFEMQLLKASILEIDAAIDVYQVQLNGATTEIKSRRNTLSCPPRVSDPKFQDKVNEANRRFRNRLRDALNNAEDALNSFNTHISAMSDLANHSIHITSVADAIRMHEEIELEQLKQLQLQQAADTIHARAKANIDMVRNSVEVMQPIVETVPLTVEEPIVETETETEEEVLTVTEFE